MQSIYILDRKSKEAVGILNPELPDGCPFMKDNRVERLEHGFLTLEFSVPVNHPTARLLVNENLVVYPNPDGKFELYRIKDTIGSTANGQRVKSVFCENSAVTDLMAQVVRPASFPSTNLSTVMNTVLSGTGWKVGSVPSNDNKDFNFTDYISSLEALHQALSAFGAEISFYVEFNGLTIVNKYVDVQLQRGTPTLKPFVYGVDLVDVTKEEDTTNLVTALVAVGKSQDTGNLTLANYTPPDLDTTKYTKDFSADWIGSKDAFANFALDGQHRYGVFKDDSSEIQYDLYTAAKAKLDELSIPKLTYTVNVLLLEKILGESHKVRLGDTIIVHDTEYEPEIVLQARIIETQTSIINPTANKVVLGSYVEILTTNANRAQDLLDQLAQNADQWNQAVKTAKAAVGTGAHVIVSQPLQDDTKGDYNNFDSYLEIDVKNNCNLSSVSVFCESAGITGDVYLADAEDNVIQHKVIPAMDAGENVLTLNFLMSADVGTYRLYGFFEGGNLYRRTQELNFPYESGDFTVTGSSSGFGYWYYFFNMKVGGAGVTGGYGQALQVGDANNQLGTINTLDANGEAILVIDNDQVSIGTLTAGNVISESVVNYSDDNATYYVNRDTGSDENDGLTIDTPLASVNSALQKIPKMCDGEINIIIGSDLDEPITIRGYSGLNNINIYGGTRTGASAPFTYNHYTITGKVWVDSTSKRVNFYYGRYFPSNEEYGTGSSSGTVFLTKSAYCYFRELYISGRVAGTSNYNTNCVACNDGSLGYFSSVHMQDWGSRSVRATNFGKIVFEYVTGSSVRSGVGVAEASLGAQIVYAGSGTNVLLNVSGATYPVGNASSNFNIVTGGSFQGIYTSTGLANGAQSGTSTGTPSTGATTVTYSSNNSGRTYRYTVYIGWRSEVQVMEGSYGYGFHKGLWFFSGVGATPPWVGKTIKEIWIQVTRLSKGGGAGTVRFKTHNYLSQPAGEPAIGSAYVSAYFSYGEKKWVRLDGNATIKAAFAGNTAKGIAIDGGDYAIFSSQATLKVVYQ